MRIRVKGGLAKTPRSREAPRQDGSSDVTDMLPNGTVGRQPSGFSSRHDRASLQPIFGFPHLHTRSISSQAMDSDGFEVLSR